MQFFTVAGDAVDRPQEWEPAVLDLGVPADAWETARCVVNGAALAVTLTRRFGAVRVITEWPRSGPGAYRIEVAADGLRETHTVTIDSAKLGDQGLAALVEELEQRLPASIALGLQRAGGLVRVRIRPPSENTLEQELIRLRRVVTGPGDGPGLVQLLPAIARDPHQMLASEELWVRRERARRVPVGGLVQTLTRAANLDESGRPVQVLDQRVRSTVDVYENRLLKALVAEVRGRLLRLLRLGDLKGDGTTGDVKALLDSLSEAERRATFLRDVRPPGHALDRVTMVLLREPRYRALLERHREFHRSLWVELDDHRVDAPLQNVPSLYQSWGTLLVIEALLNLGTRLGYRVVEQHIVHRRPGALFVSILANGRLAVRLRHPVDGTEVTLIPERTYGRSGTLRSTSFTQRPDVAIEIRRPDGSIDVIVLDPKYKLDADELGAGLPLKSDVDKMHAYRDAIRDSAGRHVVRMAATLYPGGTRRYGREVSALGAHPAHPTVLLRELEEAMGGPLTGRRSRAPDERTG